MALSIGAFASGTMVTTNVLAQAVSVNGGSIQGTITDASGAVVPQAKIVVVSSETGFTKTLASDSAGYYSVGPLNPGPYTVTVTAAGFSKLQVTTIIRTGTATSGNFKLSLGAASDTVEVSAGAVQINTDQIGVSGIVTREQIDSLPINGRNILDIAQLQPGVILQPGDSFDPTKSGYSALSVGGVSGRTTRILLDGQDITDETVGTTLFNVPEGAIDEFQLNRSTQDVSGEVTSTGQVLMPTRTGTNGIHGNAFYIFQDSRAGFASIIQDVRPPFQRNQFGGYVGGPIIKDKLFFFGGAERLKQDAENAAGTNVFFSSIFKQYGEVPNPFRDTFSIGRLDYNAPRGIHLFARAISSNNAADGTSGYNPYSVFKNQDNVPSIVGGADFTTGNFTHSIRYGYEKFENGIGDGTAALGSSIYNPSSILGFQITLDGSINAGQNLLAPQRTFQSDKQLRYDGTWTKAAHTVKFGAEMNRILNGGDAPFFGGSVFTVLNANSATFLLSQCANPAEGTGPCPGDPLYGYSAEEFIIGNGNGLFSERPGFGLPGGGDFSWRFASYVADTWKAKPYLTIQGGLRWSVDTDRANQDLPTPLCSQVDPALQPGCSGDTPLFDQYGPGLGLGKKTHQPYGNFGPQLGFVYSPGSHKISIRGGAGIFFESNIFNNTGNARTPEITAQGQYFNNGAAYYASPTITLPGYPTVTGLLANGTPCTPAPNNAACISVPQLFTESIAQSAATINGLKTLYDASAKVPGPNPSFIGTGGGLSASNIYAGPYKSPYSIQINGGVQYEISKGIIVSADYVHNATLKVPTTVDTNHVGAARFLNVAAAQAAIAATLANCGAASIDAAIQPGGCPGGSATDASGNPTKAALIDDFASNGLDSGIDFLGGYSAVADGLPQAAFGGANPNVGQGKFILPVGKSGYDALQIVVQEQKAHPLPYINSSNFQISYNLSRVTTTSTSSDQFFGGNGAYNQDHVTRFMGRNSLDHTNQLSLGGSIGIKYGLQVGAIAHFYSAPPSTLTLPTSSGAGQIFKTDVDGDGTEGDLVPGTNPGAYMHSIKGAGLNKLISTYNSQYAGQLTPAGQALVSAGLFTANELLQLNAVQQPLAPAPNNPIGNAAFRAFDLNFSYPIRLTKYREGLSITPGVVLYNVANLTNFNGFGGLATLADAPYSAGQLNGPNNSFNYDTNRVGRGTGTFDAGGPRSTEFNLKIDF
jgi:hypothetical protein